MISREQADRFAREWIEAWNSLDLERILAHYGDDFTVSSPRIAALAQEPSGTLSGLVRLARARYASAARACEPTCGLSAPSVRSSPAGFAARLAAELG